MSWPNSWQVQPGYAGYATAAAPPSVAPAAAAAALPGAYSAMTPEQYAQWQQWQQYQQQYAQWHAQYGEQYARQMGKPLPAVPAPMPLQHMGLAATNVPPPTVAMTQPVPASVVPPASVAMAAVVAPIPPIAVAPPIPSVAAAPPPPLEPHPDSVASEAPAPPPPASEESEQSQKTAEELAFDEQFRKWEEEFNNWKRKNANHPDRNAYNEYEKKFIECRKKLLERREQLRNKRLAEREVAKAPAAAASATSISSVGNYQYNQPPPPPPPEEESGMEVGVFKNALSGGAASGGGIPGLDFINDDRPENQIEEEVMEVINLDDENEDKLNKEHVREANAKPPANPVNALASLLKDPKVSALLNVISGNNNGQGVNLANLGNQELLQQIQNAAGAVINANQNGNSGQNTPNQSTIRAPEVHTPLSEDRSRTSFHDDRRSVVSMDDRSHDFDDFNRSQPLLRNNMDFIQGPPPNRAGGFGFDASIPPPLLGIDLSKPPPPIGLHPVPRPYRSDQPSPAPSNSSSTSRQRQASRWVGGNRDVKQEPDPEHEIGPFRNDFSQRPPMKEEPFNGSDCPPPGENWKYYDGHQDELQIDPELGTPCAVPKPEWMTEDEYEEIYDRFEHIDVFEERKAKMQQAIQLLKEKKDKDKPMQTSTPNKQPFKFEDSNINANNSGESRWQGGMPKPLKEEPGQKRANPFASDDDYFRPKQVIDYSNGRPQPQVFDYGHSSSGPVAKDVDERNTDWKSGNPDSSSNMSFRKDEDLRFDRRNNDWRNMGGNRGDRDERQPFFRGGRGGRGGGGGRGGRFSNEDFQQPPPNRFDFNHAPPSLGPGFKTDVPPPPFMNERPPNYTDNSTNRLAAMHDNPHPDESNPCYPSKFILMNDNRPNRPSTKRGKRASSIRKQKLREQHEHEQEQEQEHNPFGDNSHGDVDERQIMPQVFMANSGPVVERPSDFELDMKRGSEECDDPKSPFYLPPTPIVCIEDLLLPPGRFKRPQRICFILRGIPGSGKSYLARLIKDCEVKNGGQAPRVLSIDDYFLVEKEEREPDPKTGRPVLVTRSEYEFDADMEEEYMKNLIKAFKRTITERLYNFVIVDCVNERLEFYNEFHNFGRSNGFKVYTCTLQTELEMCIEQNIHKRTTDDIRAYANRWALCPNDHVQINASMLFNPEDAEQPQPDMELCTEEDDLALGDGGQPAMDEEENDQPRDDIVDEEDSNFDGPELGFFTSKWDADTSEQNLARLDGISKPPRRPPTIEDFLQQEGDDLDDARPGGSSSGKKRVRWADIEERKAQNKMRQMGFVVGVTDWSRMMDPTGGSRALTKTKYIERVRRQF